MNKLRTNELSRMSETDLNDRLRDLNKELMKINAQISIGTIPENPGKVKQVKKTIAKINMILHQKTFKKEEPKQQNKQKEVKKDVSNE